MGSLRCPTLVLRQRVLAGGYVPLLYLIRLSERVFVFVCIQSEGSGACVVCCVLCVVCCVLSVVCCVLCVVCFELCVVWVVL